MLTFPIRAQANPEKLPKGERVELTNVPNPGTYQCFGFEDYKKIVSIYFLGFLPCLEENKVLQQELDLSIEQLERVQQITKLQGDAISTLKQENDRLFEKWRKENDLRHQAEATSWTETLGWGLAAAFAASTVVLSGVLILKD